MQRNWPSLKRFSINRPFHDQLGISLIEVLVSLMLLSIAVLGFAKMQINSIRYENDAYFQSVAETQLQSMIERLLANKNSYQNEIVLWNANNERLLPQGYGTVSGSKPIKITIHWRDQQAGQTKHKTRSIYL